MCYLIAKKFEKQGCIAVKTKYGKDLSDMVKALNKQISGEGV